MNNVQLNKPIEEDIRKACEVLRAGGTILYPTDTIWGLGCDATNEEAVEKLYKIKERDKSKSMLVLLNSPDKLQVYVQDVPDIAWNMIELSTTPLTIIYEGAKNLATNLVAADGTIGIRITAETFSAELCRRFGKPVVSTSANISGHPSPTSFSDIEDAVRQRVDYIVSYRQDEQIRVKPSGVLKLCKNGTIKIIRK